MASKVACDHRSHKIKFTIADIWISAHKFEQPAEVLVTYRMPRFCVDDRLNYVRMPKLHVFCHMITQSHSSTPTNSDIHVQLLDRLCHERFVRLLVTLDVVGLLAQVPHKNLQVFWVEHAAAQVFSLIQAENQVAHLADEPLAAAKLETLLASCVAIICHLNLDGV